VIEIAAINITFEYDYAYGGMFVSSFCNYPEFPKTGNVIFDNHTVYIKEKLYADINFNYLYYSGPFNLTLNMINSTIS